MESPFDDIELTVLKYVRDQSLSTEEEVRLRQWLSQSNDPDREALDNRQRRWSFVYELTPIQFVQLRMGARLWEGTSPQPDDHMRLYFVELHGFF